MVKTTSHTTLASRVPFKNISFLKALKYAVVVLGGDITLDFTDGATHYHATYVRPAWAKTKTRTTRIDRHIFYRWEI